MSLCTGNGAKDGIDKQCNNYDLRYCASQKGNVRCPLIFTSPSPSSIPLDTIPVRPLCNFHLEPPTPLTFFSADTFDDSHWYIGIVLLGVSKICYLHGSGLVCCRDISVLMLEEATIRKDGLRFPKEMFWE